MRQSVVHQEQLAFTFFFLPAAQGYSPRGTQHATGGASPSVSTEPPQPPAALLPFGRVRAHSHALVVVRWRVDVSERRRYLVPPPVAHRLQGREERVGGFQRLQASDVGGEAELAIADGEWGGAEALSIAADQRRPPTDRPTSS